MRYLRDFHDPWSLPQPGSGEQLLIYISCAQFSQFDWAGWKFMKDPCVAFFLTRTSRSPHWFMPAIHQARVAFIPLFCLRVSNTASRIPYREASSHKTSLHYSEFCVPFFAPCRGSECVDLGF